MGESDLIERGKKGRRHVPTRTPPGIGMGGRGGPTWIVAVQRRVRAGGVAGLGDARRPRAGGSAGVVIAKGRRRMGRNELRRSIVIQSDVNKNNNDLRS